MLSGWTVMAWQVISKKLIKKKNHVSYMRSEKEILTKVQFSPATHWLQVLLAHFCLPACLPGCYDVIWWCDDRWSTPLW
jgi:hypothetical protein